MTLRVAERVLRFLCAHRLCKETAPATYKPLPQAMMFAGVSVPASMIRHLYVLRCICNLRDTYISLAMHACKHL